MEETKNEEEFLSPFKNEEAHRFPVNYFTMRKMIAKGSDGKHMTYVSSSDFHNTSSYKVCYLHKANASILKEFEIGEEK